MSAPQIKRRTVYQLYQLAWSGLDWLYPPMCGGCGRELSRWCPECQEKAALLPKIVCQCCGQVLNNPGLCTECQDCQPAYTALRSWAGFSGPVRNALHRLKYKKDIALGEILARHLVNMLGELAWKIDIVAPVPIGVARLAERGYNQATFLALPVALAIGRPYRPTALVKVKETRTQVGLNSEQRKVNVVGAYQARTNRVMGKSVLVVDDVTTTGATLHACAEALLDAGASQVYGLTLARAI
jgi:competence protein ComFC